MAGYRGHQGRKLKASTIVARQRKAMPQNKGTYSRSRLPSPPAHLSSVAQAEWRRIGRQLLAAGLLSNLDTNALALLCDATARWLNARAILDGPVGFCANCDPRNKSAEENLNKCVGTKHLAFPYGLIIASRLGRVGPSPYLKIANDAGAQMAKLQAEFGMTPASRSRIPREEGKRKRKAQEWANAPELLDPRRHLSVNEAIAAVEGGS